MRNGLLDGAKLIAEGDWGTKVVFEYNGYIYLRGFGNCDHVWFNKDTWNEFASVIIKATKIINGEEDERMMESKKIIGIPARCNCIACGKPLSMDGSEPYVEMHMERSASEWANVYAHEGCFHKAAEDIYDAYMAGELHIGEKREGGKRND